VPPQSSTGGIERIAVMAITNDATKQLTPALDHYLTHAGEYQLIATKLISAELAKAKIDANQFREVGRHLDAEAVLYSTVHIFEIGDSEHQEEIRISYKEDYSILWTLFRF
tara:strand:+ start:163 stop:495 length:333 start_codon:yes stop_codon:yes gene_type:complete